MRVSIEKNYTLMIEGPAKAKVIEGKFDVFGVEREAGFETSIDIYKAAPFYALEESTIEVKEGKVSFVKGSTIPNSWKDAVEKIKKKYRIIAVLGDVDVGKSGFITYALNKLLKDGVKVAIIDADTGQSDIGPPTTIGLGIPEKSIVMLSEIPLYDAVFIGLTSPSGLLHRSVAAISRLSKLALEKADVVMVNTTGWIGDSGGRDLKISKILALNPDLIIGIEGERELEHLLQYFEKIYDVERLEPAITLRPRTREERKVIRSNLYARYFEGASEKEVDFKKLGVSYSFFWTGQPFENHLKLEEIVGSRIVWAEESSDSLVVISESAPRANCRERLKETFKVREVRVYTREYLSHVLVAFGSKEKTFLGLGIIKDFIPETSKLIVYTNVKIAEADFIQFGYIRVNPETFEEEGWIDRWSL